MRSSDPSHKLYGDADPDMIAAAEAFTFECGGERLIGIIDKPARPAAKGVLIVVGGPQYRAGSHRQFVLLARRFSSDGFPVMRFDCRGMGDSTGEMRTFEHIDADLKAAIDIFIQRCPWLTEIVLWGLCDAASAICFYATQDLRVRGIVLVNPWVRTVEGAAKARLKHYYMARAWDRALWTKLFQGEFRFRESLRDLIRTVIQITGRLWRRRVAGTGMPAAVDKMGSLSERMASGLQNFHGDILLILSGRDLTAKEFEEAAYGSAAWRGLLQRRTLTRHRLVEADHTFSRKEWREQISEWTTQWIQSW